MAYRTLLILAACLIAGQAQAGGNLNLLAGQKSLAEEDWAPVDEHGSRGVMFDYTPAGAAVGLALDYLESDDSAPVYGVDTSLETAETHLGLRWYSTDAQPLRFYLGGGVALIKARLTLDDNGARERDESEDFGLWMNAGAVYALGRHLNVGADVRVSAAEGDLFGQSFSTGGSQMHAFVGLRF